MCWSSFQQLYGQIKFEEANRLALFFIMENCILCQPVVISSLLSLAYGYSFWKFTGAPFPSNFKEVVKIIFKRLFRVYAHIYHSHFPKIVSLKEQAHLNTCFKHFILFTWVSASFDLAIYLSPSAHNCVLGYFIPLEQIFQYFCCE